MEAVNPASLKRKFNIQFAVFMDKRHRIYWCTHRTNAINWRRWVWKKGSWRVLFIRHVFSCNATMAFLISYFGEASLISQSWCQYQWETEEQYIAPRFSEVVGNNVRKRDMQGASCRAWIHSALVCSEGALKDCPLSHASGTLFQTRPLWSYL